MQHQIATLALALCTALLTCQRFCTAEDTLHTHIHARYHIDLPATLLHCCNMQHANIFAHLIESFVNIFPICVIIERDMQCTLHTHVHTYIHMQLRRLLAASAAVAPLWLPPGANALKATIRV